MTPRAQVPGTIAQDCGKSQCNAKNNGDLSFINEWIIEGLVDPDQLVLDCR
jgi:hypothetical protein